MVCLFRVCVEGLKVIVGLRNFLVWVNEMKREKRKNRMCMVICLFLWLVSLGRLVDFV